MPLVFNQWLGDFDRSLDHGGQLNRLPVQIDFSPGDSRNVQQVIHQARELVGLAVDHVVSHVHERSAGRRSFKYLQGVPNRRQRVP